MRTKVISRGRRALMVVALLALVAPSGVVPASAVGVNVAYLDSEPGETLLNGRQVYYDGSNSSYHTVSAVGDDFLWLQLNTTDAFASWAVTFVAGEGQTLHVGSYENATGGSNPSLWVTSGSPGDSCSGSGRFVIHEYERDAGGSVTSLAVSFQQTCPATGKSLFGEIRFQSAVSLRGAILEPASRTFDPTVVGSTGQTVEFTLTAIGTVALTLASISVAGIAAADYELGGTCVAGTLSVGSSCTVGVTFKPTLDGTRTARLVVDENSFRGQREALLGGLGRLFEWGSVAAAGPAFTWTWGHGLAQTVSNGKTYLHAIHGTDRVNGAWVTNSGPYAAVSYVRSGDGGDTWSAPKRLNPGAEHGDRMAIATSGTFVYAVWVRIRKWVNFNGADPRPLYIRVSSDNGSTWRTVQRLTSKSGRVDLPTVAASGQSVYVAYTNSDTGDVRVLVSHDRGASWSAKTVGTTSLNSSQGRIGVPVVAATGSRVGVTWLRGVDNAQARISTTSGSTWKAAVKLGSPGLQRPTVTAGGGRIVFGWPQGFNVRVRTWDSGWAPVRTVTTGSGISGQLPYDVAVAANGDSRIAISFSQCSQDCGDSYEASSRVGIYWRYSSDEGVSWRPTDLIAPPGESSARRINDAASIVWVTSGAPTVMFGGWTPGSLNYRLYTAAAE